MDNDGFEAIVERIKREGSQFSQDLQDSQKPWQYIIRTQAHIEVLIKYILRHKLTKPESFKEHPNKIGFVASVDLLDSLGVPIEEKKKGALKKLAKIRNKFAHDPFKDAESESKIVTELYDSMHPEQLKGFRTRVPQEAFEAYKHEPTEEPMYLKELLISLYAWLQTLAIQIEIEKEIQKLAKPVAENIAKHFFPISGDDT